MKKMNLAAVITAFLLLTSSLFGCQLGQQEESSMPSEMPSSSVSEPESSVVSSQPESSVAESSVNEVVDTITTDNEEFNKLFAENPLDAAYKRESGENYSAVDMEQTATKFAGLWQAEIDSAYKKLLEFSSGTEKDQYKAEQEKWIAETPNALEKILEEAQEEGGSMANVTAAGNTMEYYRARAAQIYRALYNYDKEFQFEYSEK